MKSESFFSAIPSAETLLYMVDNKDQTEHKNRHIDDLCKAMMKKTIRK